MYMMVGVSTCDTRLTNGSGVPCEAAGACKEQHIMNLIVHHLSLSNTSMACGWTMRNVLVAVSTHL